MKHFAFRSRHIAALGALFVMFGTFGTSHAMFGGFFTSPKSQSQEPTRSENPGEIPSPILRPPPPCHDLLESFGYKPSYGSDDFRMPKKPKGPPPEDFTFRKRMHRMHREDREDRMQNRGTPPQDKP